jgi:hypothetical protein
MSLTHTVIFFTGSILDLSFVAASKFDCNSDTHFAPLVSCLGGECETAVGFLLFDYIGGVSCVSLCLFHRRWRNSSGSKGSGGVIELLSRSGHETSQRCAKYHVANSKALLVTYSHGNQIRKTYVSAAG